MVPVLQQQQETMRLSRELGCLRGGCPGLPFVQSTPALQEFHPHKRLSVCFPTHTCVCKDTSAHTQAVGDKCLVRNDNLAEWVWVIRKMRAWFELFEGNLIGRSLWCSDFSGSDFTCSADGQLTSMDKHLFWTDRDPSMFLMEGAQSALMASLSCSYCYSCF